MKTRYVIETAVIALVSAMAMALFHSCDFARNKAIVKATDAISRRDYRSAMNFILKLDDDKIIESDTLMQMLSTSYYGLSLKPTREIASDCYDMDFTNDGDTVIFTDFHKGSLNFYSFPEMEYQRSISMPERAFSIDISPAGDTIAAAMANNMVMLYDLATGEILNVLEGHTNGVRDVVFATDTLLFSCSNDRRVVAWDVKSGTAYWSKRQHSKNVKSLQISKDGKYLTTASNDGSSSVIRANGKKAGSEILRVVHGENYVNDAAISPDNRFLVTVSGDGYAKFWNVTDGSPMFHIFLNDRLGAVDISDDGKYILVGGEHNAYLLDLATRKILSIINGSNMAIWSVKILNNDRFAFADNSRFWTGKILTGSELIKAAREIQSHMMDHD